MLQLRFLAFEAQAGYVTMCVGATWGIRTPVTGLRIRVPRPLAESRVSWLRSRESNPARMR